MERKVEEVVASQHKMSGKNKSDYPYKLVDFYEQHLKEIKGSTLNQVNIETLFIDHAATIKDTDKVISQVIDFLPELNLHTDNMKGVIDKTLYRNKKS